MISVQEVIQDPDFIAPKAFTILRSSGVFVEGGFKSTTESIDLFGPVQQASLKEISMLPEGDRVGSILSFWCTIPVYLTRGSAPVPSVHTEKPAQFPGNASKYILSEEPPNLMLTVYAGGMQLAAGIDYTLTGVIINFTVIPSTPVWCTWPVTVMVGQGQSDIIVYGIEQYRVLSRYHDPGCGYYKALGTRMSSS